GFAGLGARVAIVGRDAERTRATADWIKQTAGGAQVPFLVGDLSSQAEIRRLAREFKERHARLDVLVNNAGAIFTHRETTVDGFERPWALNHLAYVLFTRELLDPLKASAPARIGNVASTIHPAGVVHFARPPGRRRM